MYLFQDGVQTAKMMERNLRHILVLADIEGSSGCWNDRGSRFLTSEWARACLELTLDVQCLVEALFDRAVRKITVVDFHRTGFNLIPGKIDARARIVQGYRLGPIPGMGESFQATGLMMVGMHAASGTSGFLAHTLTSRFLNLTLSEKPLPECLLFAGSLAPYGVSPLFFSGCPVACSQAEEYFPGIPSHSIDKNFPMSFCPTRWREELANKAVESLSFYSDRPVIPPPPYSLKVTMKGKEEETREYAKTWGFSVNGNTLCFQTCDFSEIFWNLVRLAYLKPGIEKLLPIGLSLYRVIGRFGLSWVRHLVKRSVLSI